MSYERDSVSPAEKARWAIQKGRVMIIEAEGWLEDAARLAPAEAPELRRLIKVLHETGAASGAARDRLEKEVKR